jgi:hypothetical protein
MFIRTRIINGRTYSSLEERYRQDGKVKSRHIRSLGAHKGFDRHLDGYAGEFHDMQQGYEQLQSREAAKSSAATSKDAPGVDDTSKGEGNGDGDQ